MPKMKTHSATKKRLRTTGTGKIVHKQAYARHYFEHKSSTRKRRLGRMAEISPADRRRARKLLGG